jgi:hypothetical protein
MDPIGSIEEDEKQMKRSQTLTEEYLKTLIDSGIEQEGFETKIKRLRL